VEKEKKKKKMKKKKTDCDGFGPYSCLKDSHHFECMSPGNKKENGVQKRRKVRGPGEAMVAF